VTAFQRAATPLIATLEPPMTAVFLELHLVSQRRHWI
jgi:hypothetical protein